jgi:heterodisulfide reductase subunit A-like polyferredoxin
MEKGKKKKIGAVLVQGGGIAGVQASLDLANSGFKVYLVENSAAIGGMMAHLDKTFPTGDCATCIVSPIVELPQSVSDLTSPTQSWKAPGNFKAMSNYPIDEKTCNDCGDCTKACPVEIADRYNRDLGKRKVIQKYSPQAIPNKPRILKLGHPPGKMECPATSTSEIIQLIRKKNIKAATSSGRETPWPRSAVGSVPPPARAPAPVPMWMRRWPYGSSRDSPWTRKSGW